MVSPLMMGGIGAGIGALSGLFGGSEGGQTSRTSVYGPQAGYLQDIFKQGQDIYRQQGQQGYMSDLERRGIQQGQEYLQGIGELGGDLQGGLKQAYEMAQKPQDFSIDYQNVQRNLQQQQPFLQDIISQSTSDIYQQLAEGPLQQSNLAGVAGGNLASSRKAVQDAVLGSKAADQASRISADVMSQGYQQALGLEQNRIGQEYAAQQAQIGQLTGLGQLGAQYGAGVGEGLLGLGQYQFTAPTRALQAYQTAIGNPIMESSNTQLAQGGGVGGFLSGISSGFGTGLSGAGLLKKYGVPEPTSTPTQQPMAPTGNQGYQSSFGFGNYGF